MKKILMLLALTLSLTLGAALAPAQAQKSMIDEVLERGVLRVGFASFVPWAMQNKQGEFIGFDIDVATRLAEDLGVKLQLAPTKWGGILPALLSGKFDVIISSMSPTPERTLKANFTIPYDYSVTEMTLNKEKAAGINSMADLNKPEIIIALRTGTTAAIATKKNIPNATYRMFDDEAPAMQEVLAGRAHAFFSSAPLPTAETLKNSDRLVQPFKVAMFPQPVGMTLRKGDVDSLNVLENWIRQVEGQGWLEERRQYWFHSNEWEKDVQ